MTKKKRTYKGISIAARKAKARRLQNFMAERLSKITGLSYGQPGDHDKDYRGREMGQKGVDVIMSRWAKQLTPFSIECKNAETWKLNDDLAQARANEQEATDWLLVYKKNRVKPICIMDAELFFKLLESALYGYGTMEKERKEKLNGKEKAD